MSSRRSARVAIFVPQSEPATIGWLSRVNETDDVALSAVFSAVDRPLIIDTAITLMEERVDVAIAIGDISTRIAVGAALVGRALSLTLSPAPIPRMTLYVETQEAADGLGRWYMPVGERWVRCVDALASVRVLAEASLAPAPPLSLPPPSISKSADETIRWLREEEEGRWKGEDAARVAASLLSTLAQMAPATRRYPTGDALLSDLVEPPPPDLPPPPPPPVPPAGPRFASLVALVVAGRDAVMMILGGFVRFSRNCLTAGGATADTQARAAAAVMSVACGVFVSAALLVLCARGGKKNKRM